MYCAFWQTTLTWHIKSKSTAKLSSGRNATALNPSVSSGMHVLSVATLNTSVSVVRADLHLLWKVKHLLWHHWIGWQFKCIAIKRAAAFCPVVWWSFAFYMQWAEANHQTYICRFFIQVLYWYCSISILFLIILKSQYVMSADRSIIFSKAFQFDILNVLLLVQVRHD